MIQNTVRGAHTAVHDFTDRASKRIRSLPRDAFCLAYLCI